MLKKTIRENAGHPWDGRNGWDGMDVLADTKEELDSFIKTARKQHWSVWIEGSVGRPDGTPDIQGRPAAYLYKPHRVKSVWSENPSSMSWSLA